MKQKMVLLALFLGMFFMLNGDVFAQKSKTKCPPKRSFFKSQKQRDKLAKFPQLTRKGKREQARIEKEWETEAFAAKANEEKKRDNRYLKSRSIKFKKEKISDKNIASTKCPH